MQVLPQLIPAADEVTVPVPPPALETVRAKPGTKVAVTALAAVIDKVHTLGAVPAAQAAAPVPVQPENAEVALLGVAVRVTLLPEGKL